MISSIKSCMTRAGHRQGKYRYWLLQHGFESLITSLCEYTCKLLKCFEVGTYGDTEGLSPLPLCSRSDSTLVLFIALLAGTTAGIAYPESGVTLSAKTNTPKPGFICSSHDSSDRYVGRCRLGTSGAEGHKHHNRGSMNTSTRLKHCCFLVTGGRLPRAAARSRRNGSRQAMAATTGKDPIDTQRVAPSCSKRIQSTPK